MPVLDAKALKTDPEGLAFLRDVLNQGSRRAADERKAKAKAADPSPRAPASPQQAPDC